ncbi:hypothetical protein CVS40_12911 [Lucilia cuprina]|nr:hypothetical protein CVS40_12911 [Lucilia cuprina]
MSACQLLNSSSNDNYCAAIFHNKLNQSSIEQFLLIWIPSHVGITINETADEIDTGAVISVYLTPQEALREIRNTLRYKWDEKYMNLSNATGKLIDEIFPSVLEKQMGDTNHMKCDWFEIYKLLLNFMDEAKIEL